LTGSDSIELIHVDIGLWIECEVFTTICNEMDCRIWQQAIDGRFSCDNLKVLALNAVEL
jgi:hypothetical protein